MKKLLFSLAFSALLATPMLAQANSNADKYTGVIFYVAGNYCPKYSLEANGQILKVIEYPDLFELFKYKYGGDGNATFALPKVDSIYSEIEKNVSNKKVIEKIALKSCVVWPGIRPQKN